MSFAYVHISNTRAAVDSSFLSLFSGVRGACWVSASMVILFFSFLFFSFRYHLPTGRRGAGMAERCGVRDGAIARWSGAESG